jgi:eukaryotic-like serine/threonine-protein kinase
MVALERFELRQELGSGAAGTVWRAWDRQRSTEVALKILHRVDTEVMRRFKHEFRTLADLRHRNIVRFHELFEVDERWFFSMELIDGVDLLSWIWGYQPQDLAPAEEAELFEQDTKPSLLSAAGPKVDYDRLREAFAQLVDGLEQLHATGTLHRDLKPSNLIVRRDGRLSILDFGLAVSVLSHSQDRQAAVGTVAYMSPEVAEQRTADAYSDYYSVGVLLFEALTGRTPFPGGSITELLAAKLTGDAPPPSSLVSGVPEDLDQLCRGLLRRDPGERAGAAHLEAAFRLGRRPALDAPGAPTSPLSLGHVLDLSVRPASDRSDHRSSDRSSDRSADRSAAPSLPPYGPATALARGSGAIARPPVVGRNREVEVLSADLAEVARAGLQWRLVTGPSGIGKTALAEAFVRRMTSQALVLVGRCHDREAIPFRAIDEIIDGLAQHLGRLPDGERERLLPARADLLAELFPVLRGLGGERASRPPSLDPEWIRAQAFAALRQLLTAMGRQSPVALIVDDLHLADPDSLDLLDQVFGGDHAPPLLLVGLGRPGAVMDQIRHAAEKVPGRLHDLDLGPLSREEAEWVARTLATYLAVEVADAASIAIDTRGHPGFTLEILRAAMAPTSNHSAPALESVLAMRILNLREPTRRVLELLSVSGGLCSVELTADVLGYSVGEVAAALDDLVDADLVVATGRSHDDAFEFYHERIGEVAAATLSKQTVTAINHALAEGLERRGDSDLDRLLHHWQAGGDRARAAYYRTRVAAAWVSAQDFRRVAELHETTLRDPIPIALECEVRTELAMAYGYLGRPADSAAEYLAASRLASFEVGLELKRRAAEALLYAADVEAGCQLIEEVIADLGHSAPQQRIWQLAATVKGTLSKLVPRRPFTERSAASVPALQSLALDALATASLSVGVLEPLRGRVYQHRHFDAARQVGDPSRYARALCAEATSIAAAGSRHRRAVQDLLAEATELCRARAPQMLAEVSLGYAIANFLLGDFASARDAVAQCLPALESEGPQARWALRQARSYTSWLHWMRGDYAALRSQVPRWAAQAAQAGDRFSLTVMTTATNNQAWLLADDLGGAESRIEDAERTWSLRAAPIMRWHIAAARANLELYRGNPHKALATLRAVAPAAARADLHRVELIHVAMTHLNLRAELAMAATAPNHAAGHLATASALVRTLRAIRAPWARAIATLGAATILEHAGRPDAARLRYEQAERELGDCQLGGYAAAASWRAAHARGGLQGDARKVELCEAAAAQGIADPGRFFAHLIGA